MESLKPHLDDAKAQRLFDLLQKLPVPKEQVEDLAQAIVAYAGSLSYPKIRQSVTLPETLPGPGNRRISRVILTSDLTAQTVCGRRQDTSRA